MASKSASQDDYVLSRNYAATSRLNLQHFLWREVFGYLLHPSVDIQGGMKIADVGTGTGQWLFDLSQQSPKDCDFVGLDVDISQAPPSEWIPANVALRQWNATEEPPADLVAQFDVVHIRLFIFVVKDNDPLPILRNILKLLKPRGLLQWGEPDFETRKIVKSHPSNSSDSLEELFAMATAQDRRLQPTWVAKLPLLFQSAGLTDVDRDQRTGSPHLWFAFNECNMMVYDEILESSAIPPERQATMRHLLELASKECREGVANISDRVHVTGRKPVATDVM